MTNKNKLSRAFLGVSLLTFILFIVYILYLNQEVLYTAHDRSEFLFGAPFFNTLMSKPFGLMQYVGAWLTQFFCKPIVGTGILAAIWAMIYFVGTKAFRLQGSASALMLLPVACLLVSVVDLGYWIYISTIRGYWFSQSVGYLFMLLLLWAAGSTPRKWHLVWYVLGACIYPILGWYALLFVVCLALGGKTTWRELVGVVLLLFTSSIWHTQFYSNLKFDDVVLAGMPRFETPSDSGPQLSYPFWLLGAVSVLIPLCGKYLAKWYIPVLCAAAGISYTWSQMFYDKNYIDEMRMVRYAADDNWKEVLNISADNPKPTTTMVMLKNVALMNEGGLLDRSFKTGNIGYPITNPDSIHVSFLDIASPLVYYNYGLINEGIRLNFEKAIQVGFSPFYLKTLSRCNLAKGDKALVERYSSLLHHMFVYANWQPAAVTGNVKSLQNCYPDEVTGVENSDSYIVNTISLWQRLDSKVASEQRLFYAMLRCDAHRFWPSLRNYLNLHIGEDFPLHAQEAYIFFIDRFPEEKRMMIPVEENVYNRYKQFCKSLTEHVKPGKTLGEAAKEMHSEWGDTYWYYNIFGRQYSHIVERKGSEVQS
ncbi:MAG: hypothetical protein IKM78_03685 [Prevotella sp.]|nr:hypothetical protein [Prevotella sp.]